MAHVIQLLRDKRDLLDRVAAELLGTEVLKGSDFASLVREAARPHA